MKKLNLMIVTHEPPCVGHGGGGNYLDLMIKNFLKRGHKVSIFLSNWGFLDNETLKKSFKQLKKRNAKIKLINFQNENLFSKLKKIFYLFLYPENLYFKQNGLLRVELENFCKKINPNVLFLFCGQSLKWSKNITKVKKFCPLVELPFLNAKYKFIIFFNNKSLFFSFKKILLSLVDLYISYVSQKKLINLFKNIDFPAHVSYDYYKFFKKKGVKEIKYYNCPIEDLNKKYLQLRNASFKKYSKNKYVIIMTGKMSTITYLQYEYLQNQILPEIEKNIFVRDSIEIRLLGSEKINDFSTLYKKSFVNHVGYSENFFYELINSYIYLSPSPRPLGSRSRLNEGMAYGCCILSSKFDKEADPNLIDNYNCLIASNPLDYVKKIELLIKKPNYRNLIRKNGIKTYNTRFKKDVVCYEYEKDILKICN